MSDEPMLHDWRIEPREYARQEERRGKRHAFAHLSPASTALVVVDMAPFFMGNPYCKGIVPQINALAECVCELGGMVAWVLPSAEQPHPGLAREFYGETVAELFRTSGGAGPLQSRVARELSTHSEDLFVEKTASSAFFPGACPLDGLLRAHGVDTMLITGTVTNICCESTARDASTSGYRVVMVADGCAARRDADHNATLHNIYRSFGDVRPANEIIALLAAS